MNIGEWSLDYRAGTRGNGMTLKGVGALVRKPRIVHIILGAALWGLVIAELAILLPSLFIWQREQITRLELATLALTRANVDGTGFPTVDQVVRMGERLVRVSDVRGGAIYNAIGEEIASFGERPTLGAGAVRREGRTQERSGDGRRIDFFMPREATGLGNNMVLRVDSSSVNAEVMTRAIDKAQGILISAAVAALAVIVILVFAIVRPILKLRDAAIAATDNPDRAEQFRVKWTRRDELGEAARALDMLLTAVSVTHQEDLAAGQAATEKSHHAVITYDHNGRLTAANAATLKLFGLKTLDEFMRGAQEFVRVPGQDGMVDITPVALLGRGDISQTVQIVTSTVVRRCQFSGIVIQKRDGRVLRYVVTLVDISKQAAYTEALEAEVARAQGEATRSKRQLAELRAMFESCLVLLEATSGAVTAASVETGEEEPIALSDRILNLWYTDAQKAGLVEGRLEHGILPPVRGQTELVEAVFRQALTLVYTRSTQEKVTLRVSAEAVGAEHATFTVSEIIRANTPRAKAGAAIVAGRAIALAGLSLAVRKIGGRIDDADLPGNGLAMTLPAVITATDADTETLIEPPRRVGGVRG
jgi:PAS domain-containing protein